MNISYMYIYVYSAQYVIIIQYFIINIDPSVKAYYKEFRRVSSFPPPSHVAIQHVLPQVVEASDVVIEVLDARDPMGSRCFEVQGYISCRSVCCLLMRCVCVLC